MKFREDPHQASGGYGRAVQIHSSQDPRLRSWEHGWDSARSAGDTLESRCPFEKKSLFESTIRRRAISWAEKYRGGTERSGDSAPRVKFSRSFPTLLPHTGLVAFYFLCQT